MPKEPITYTHRYAILAGRTAYADYVRRQQAIDEGIAINLEAFSPDNDASIMKSLHDGQFATTADELASYLAKAGSSPVGQASTVPQKPLSLCVIPRDSSLLIYFLQGSDGGSPITNYSYSTNGVTFTELSPSQTTTPLTISGLTNGTVYTIYLKAINLVGASPASSAVSAAPIPSSFTPASIAGLNVWLDGQNTTNVIVTEGAVSAWNDSSSETNNFTSSGTGTIRYDQPSTINNRPAVSFATGSPTSTYLSNSFNIASGTNQLSLFIVLTQTGTTTGNSELFFTRNDYRYFDIFNNTNMTGLLSLNIGNDTQRNSTVDIITTPPTITLLSVVVSTTASIYVNGTITAVNGVARGVLSLDNVLDWAISGGAFLGSIGEVVAYPTSLTDIQRQQIEAYLAWKWGLQANLPVTNYWKLTPPSALPANPDPPTDPIAVASNRRATVSFNAPINTGGIPITSYIVTSTPGGFTGTATSSPVTVTGLTNGSDYTFTVIANNAVGNSLPSSPSPSVTVIPIADVIVSNLTTSLSAYTAANTDDWINITSTEYNNLNTNISSSSKVGISDSYLSSAGGGGLANNKSALLANSLTTESPAIPANNYLYAFAVKWTTTEPGVGMCVFTNTNSATASGFNKVGSVLPTISSAGISYFVRKSPSATNGTAGLLACFSGTKMDYSNPSFTGSAGYIAFRVLQGTGITPIPVMRYLLGDGITPTDNSTLTGNLSGYGAFCIQGLATPTQQWA
jgi:hypothetical protein